MAVFDEHVLAPGVQHLTHRLPRAQRSRSELPDLREQFDLEVREGTRTDKGMVAFKDEISPRIWRTFARI